MFTNLIEDEIIFVEELDKSGEIVSRFKGLIAEVFKVTLNIRVERSKTDVVWLKFSRKDGRCSEKGLSSRYRISPVNAKKEPF